MVGGLTKVLHFFVFVLNLFLVKVSNYDCENFLSTTDSIYRLVFITNCRIFTAIKTQTQYIGYEVFYILSATKFHIAQLCTSLRRKMQEHFTAPLKHSLHPNSVYWPSSVKML